MLLLLAVSCIYFPYWLLVHTNIMQLQVILLFLGGIAIAGTTLWSLLPRRDKFDPAGVLLDRATHLKLFREVDEIAKALREPVPCDIYLVGAPNAFVVDVGGTLGFGGRRIMGIGLPLFSILTVSELRAVLAHEFAHFYSGDTRLGPWVYRARTVLTRSFQNMDKLQEAGVIHALRVLAALVGVAILRYFSFFLRVTSFVSRQQEYRSDELACLIAGQVPAIRGLEKIHGTRLFWDLYWMGEVAPIINRNRIPDIADGFRRFLADASIAEFVNTCIAEERESAKTNRLDTHPSLASRIAAMEQLQAHGPALDDTPALSLFDQPHSTELQFVEKANSHIPKGTLQHVAWDNVGIRVTIPLWRSEVTKFGGLLMGKKASALPDLLGRLPEIASSLPDPKGTLLTPEQRRRNAFQLLGMAVSLLLLEKGWELYKQPAVFHLRRNGNTLNAFEMVNDLAAGSLTPESWAKKCTELGIADEILGGASAPIH
ncbi:MAG TPA: M48 family metallopeptidase [Candidatus Acidoferrum sp.]